MQNEDVEIEQKITAFQGRFRIDRYRLRHRTYDGGWSAPMVREVFERGHAVAVLLYDPDADRIGLLEQFRVGAFAAGWPSWLVEIPAGMIDQDETPEQAARRETVEEAGVAADELIPICRYLASPGGSTESIHLFCARCDSATLHGIHGLPEEGEDIRAFTLTFTEAMDWIADGRIGNAMTIIAIQWLALNRDSLRAKWCA